MADARGGLVCAAPPGAERTSTIGAQKAANPLLAAADADTFADLLIAGLGEFPSYFRHLAEVNRTGPAVLSAEPPLPSLPLDAAKKALAGGAVLVDIRPVSAFGAGHVPGALSIALRPQFATWLGWLLAPGTPWIVVRENDQDVSELLWQTLKIGHSTPLGELPLGTWDGPLTTLPLVRPDRIAGRRVLDVRQPGEYQAGHVPGAVNLPVECVPGGHALEEPSVVMCGHGERAATAASLLLRDGHDVAVDVAVMQGGPWDWAKATGTPLQEGR